MIVNAGLRIDGFNANNYAENIYDPGFQSWNGGADNKPSTINLAVILE